MGMADGQNLGTGLARSSAGSMCRPWPCFAALRDLLLLHILPLAAAPCLACLQAPRIGAKWPSACRCFLRTTLRSLPHWLQQ